MDRQIGQVNIDRLNILKVPLDIVPPESISELVKVLTDGSEARQIVLLSLRDLLRARRSGEYRNYVMKATLVIPISKSLVRGARFLSGKTPVRYMPFDFVVKLLMALDAGNRSLYLLGAKSKILRITERNLRQTFPNLLIVGRCAGGFPKSDEADILTAIRKASPSLLLVSKGVPGGERWIERNKPYLSNGLQLWCSDLFDVFAEAKKRPSRTVFDRGLEGLTLCFRNPLRLFRLIPYLYYQYLLLFYKLFRRG